MIPEKFAYHRPASVAEAARLLAEIDDSWPLAGGHSLIPMMKLRFAAPAALVDLAAIESLRAIDVGDEIVSLGATVTQRQIIESKPLAAACPLLAEAALVIADPQVRYCGTIGGNVANGDPGNDMPAVMQALGARYRLFGKSGERTVAALDYYEGPFMTARAADEILTAIEIPRPPAGAGFAYEKQKRKVGDYATAAAAVALTARDGKIESAAVALTNLSDRPLLATAAAESLVGAAIDDDAAAKRAARAAAEICDPAADARGPVDFRRYVAAVVVERALARARARTQAA